MQATEVDVEGREGLRRDDDLFGGPRRFVPLDRETSMVCSWAAWETRRDDRQ